MKLHKRPLCWITRHHWLLFAEKPTVVYEDNGLTAESIYLYECQRCGAFFKQEVVDLDNLYKKGEL